VSLNAPENTVQQGHFNIVGKTASSILSVCCRALRFWLRSSKPGSKLFQNSLRIFAPYGVVWTTVCYGGAYASQYEEDAAKANADRIAPSDLPAILAGHRAGNEADSNRLRRGYTFLVFEFYQKRELWLRDHPPAKKRRKRSADDLLGQWFMDLAEQLDRCKDPGNESFQFPPEAIEGFIVGALIHSAERLNAEEKGADYLHAEDYALVKSRGEGKVGQVINDRRRTMLPAELRRIAPHAKTRFEQSVIGLALSDFDVKQIRETLHDGVTDKQIIDALETIRERADKQP
jgi:hypothetical protein